MNGLIFPEAIYLVRQALEGLRALWDRWGCVGLNEDALGLDCQGNCKVWFNKSLALDYPQDPSFRKPWEIAREVVRMVQNRS